MTYITPPSRAAGYVVTAGDYNQDLRANMQAMIPDLFTAAGQFGYSTAADVMSVGGLPHSMGGRLTLASGTAVPTTDVSGTTLYWEPFGAGGHYTTLYDGAKWIPGTLGQLSLSGTANFSSGTLPYDIFIDYNGGTPQLIAVPWTDQTTPTAVLAYTNGRPLCNGTLDYNYVGAVRCNGGVGTLADGTLTRLVWNYYNQVYRPGINTYGTATYNITSTAYQQPNGDTTLKVEYLIGRQSYVTMNHFRGRMDVNSNSSYIGIGVDSVTTATRECLTSYTAVPGNNVQHTALYEGYHVAYPIEKVNIANATSFNAGTMFIFTVGLWN